MDAITMADTASLSEILAFDIDQLTDYLKKLDVLKHALEVADGFRDKSVEFAKHEAMALIRICELGGQSNLRGHRRKAAEWLFEMRDEARAKAVEMCSDGLTIEQVWKREVKDKESSNYSISLIRMYEDDLLSEFEKKGVVKLDKFDAHADKLNIDNDTKKALKDGLRNKIRKLGGHGLGDGEGTYLTVDKAADNFDEIVFNKVDSMTRDLRRLQDLCRDEGHVPTFDFGQAYSLGNPRIMCLLILCVMGLGEAHFANHDQAIALINNICNRLGIDYGLLNKSDYEYYKKLCWEKQCESANVISNLLNGGKKESS